MNITLGEIANSIYVLEKIKIQSLDFKINYWIMRNMKVLSESYNFFIVEREKIYNLYCDKIVSDDINNGQYFYRSDDGVIQFNIKKDAKISDFDMNMISLINMECDDIHPYLLSINAINSTNDIKLSTNDIFTIDYLLAE